MHIHQRVFPVWMLLFVSFAASTSAVFAQTGTILGTLTDASGGIIPNAKVVAIDQDKKVTVRETVSGREGTFLLQSLQPGTFTVRAESAGFKALERTDLKLDPNQIMNLGNLSLQVGQTTEAVTVTAEVPTVETSTANKSFVIDSRQVTELSLNGRDFQSLMRTLPGVVSNDSSDFRLAFNNTDAFNINGLRGSNNNVFLDGTVNTDVGANDGQYTQISLDAVGEFKVQTSTFNAEYGRNPGVLISINTKSGGKDFHGTAYEFLRNNYFDARQPFDRSGTTSKLRFDQFGGNLGGPVILPKISPKGDKKLFFFFNYEKTLATRPNGGSFVDLPNPDLFTGDLSRLYRNQNILTASGGDTGFRVGQVFRPGTLVREAGGRIIGGDPYPGNIIPRAEWSRNAPAFLNILKQANYAGASPTPNVPEAVRIFFQDAYKFNKEAKVLRLDYNLNPKNNFFFRWADDANHEEQGRGIFSTLPFPVIPEQRQKPGASWTWSLVSVISPAITNEFIFGYNHLTQLVDVSDGVNKNQYDRDALGFTFKEFFPSSNVRNRFPNFNCGVATCGYSPFAPGWGSEAKSFAWTDNLTINRGVHTFKTGIFLNYNPSGQQPSWTDAMNFNFGDNVENAGSTGNTFANMLLGNYTSVNQSNGRFFGSFKFWGVEAYLQDSWKVSKKLTLEYGLRWAYLGPTQTYGQFLQNYFDPRLYDPAKAVKIDTNPGLRNGTIIAGSGDPFNGLIQEGKGIPAGFADHRYNNFGPRIGFAYDPFGDGKTAIRAGGGIFFERIRQNVNNFDGLGNPPLTFNPSLFSGKVDALSPDLIAGGVRSPVGLSTFDSRGQIPTIYSWSFGIQRELGRKTSLDIAYVGNMGRHLQYRRDLNQLPLGTTLQPGVLASVNNTSNALRPYKGFTSINFTEYGAISNYNGLQTRISRRFSSGFTGNFNYTWSKSMSEVDGDGTGIAYYLNRHREYGIAGFDRKHTVTMDWVYELPRFAKQNKALGYIANGWQVNGIARFWTGFPLTITSNGNAGTLGGGPRADYLGGNTAATTQSELDFFNIFAFGRPADGTLGTTGKAILRGPGINQWDMSLLKNTRIKERVNLQFRFETFNTFNHTQWQGVNTGLSLPNPNTAPTAATRGSFGQVNSTRDPRSLQFGMKLLF